MTGSGTGAGASDGLTAGADRASIEARDGKGVRSMESTSATGCTGLAG